MVYEKNKINKNSGFTIIELIVVMAVFLFIIGAAIGIFLMVIQNQKNVLAEQQMVNQVSYVEEYMSKAMRMAAVDTTGSCVAKGYIYLLTRYDSAQSFFTGIRFFNQSTGNCQEFFLDNLDPLTPPFLGELKGSGRTMPLDGAGNVDYSKAVAITSSGSLKINYAKFSVNGSSGGTFTPITPTSHSCAIGTPNLCGTSYEDNLQPRVTVLLNLTIPGDNTTSIKTCTSDAECTLPQICNVSLKKCIPTRVIQTTVSQRNLNANNGQR